MKTSVGLLVEMGELRLRSLVHVQDERLASEVLIKRIQSIEGIGHVDEKRGVVGLVIFELPGRMRQDMKRSLFVDLA